MMFYVLLLPRVFLTPPVASAIPILDDKPSSYRSKCCKCSGPLWVDTVEKVENRKTPKISQMLIFGQVRRWDAA
jgi:hypothetical protein